MAVISVEVPDVIAKKFKGKTVVNWSDIAMEEELYKIDGDGWIDIPVNEDAETVLNYLKSINK